MNDYVRLSDGRWVKKDSVTSRQPLPLEVVKSEKPLLTAERRGDKKRKKVDGLDIPHDGEAEQAVLGAMMIEGPAVRVARQFLKSESFYMRANEIIFTAACRIADEGFEPDVVTVIASLRDAGLIDEIGGSDYVLECVHRVASAAHVGSYVRIVAQLYLEREIIKSAHKLAQGQRVEELERLKKLHLEQTMLTSPITFDYTVGMSNVLAEILKVENSKRFNTHYKAMDNVWRGMKPGELNVWGGATNEGKSLLLLNLLDRSAQAGERCLYVGTEMTSVETVERHLSIQSNVEAWKIRIPRIDSRDMAKLQETVRVMSKMNVSILDDPEPNLAKVEAAINSSKAEIVFLDYLERFEMPKNDQLRLQIKEFMRQLKTLARRSNTVIHLAAQLNRDTYGAEVRSPTLADLAESSAIEKEADRVGLMWTPPDMPVGKSKNKAEYEKAIEKPKMADGHRLIQVINAKSRHCPRGFTFDFVLNNQNLKIQELSEYNDLFNHTI